MRKYRPYTYVVKWIQHDTMYFRYFRGDNAAMRFQDYLISQGIDQFNIRTQPV